MISRLVTVDLILTVFQRLHQLPEFSDLERTELVEISKLILNEWAMRIESEGLSVSLEAILQNAFLFFTQPDAPINLLLDYGDQLIDCAGRIESLLAAERVVQPDQTQSLQELENAVRGEGSVGCLTQPSESLGIVIPRSRPAP
jgi:hypothetical protein